MATKSVAGQTGSSGTGICTGVTIAGKTDAGPTGHQRTPVQLRA